MSRFPLYKNDGKPVLPLTPFQEQTVAALKARLASGEYALVSNPCLCGAGAGEEWVVSEKDRYGLPIPMLLCRRCGILRAGQVLDERANMDFYTYHYRSMYVGSPKAPDSFFAEQVGRGERLAAAFRGVLPPGTRLSSIFEVGCGAGGVLVPFKAMTGRCRGCDFDRNYLDYGIQQGLDLVYGDFQQALPDGSAGAVILSHVLEHFLDPAATLNEIIKKIEPGGYLVVEVPGLLNLDKVYFDPLLYLQNAHVYNFCAEHLRALFTQLGLEVVHGDEIAIFVLRKPADWEPRKPAPLASPALKGLPERIRRYLLSAFFRSKYHLNHHQWYSWILGALRHSALNQARRKWLGKAPSR